MDGSVIGAADIHRLIGRARGSSPDPAAFRAHQQLRRYHEVTVERVHTTAIRVTSTAPIRRDAPAIVFFRVISGRVSGTHSGASFQVSAGESVLLLSSGQYDFLMEAGESTQARVPLRLFAPAVLADVVGAIDSPSPPSTVNSTVWSAIDSLIDAPPRTDDDTANDQAIESLVAVLVAQVAAQILHATKRLPRRSPVLEAALLHLDRNLGDAALDLDRLAAALGTSTRTLHREFRAIGTSPMAALRDARLTAVEHRLSSPVLLPALDVLAAEYGYSDRTALSRTFARRYGQSPSEHRRRALAHSG